MLPILKIYLDFKVLVSILVVATVFSVLYKSVVTPDCTESRGEFKAFMAG